MLHRVGPDQHATVTLAKFFWFDSGRICYRKTVVTNSLTDDVERKLRNAVKTKYGNKRGAMSIIVEEALKNYFAKEN